jgi:hypothetical protein
MKKLILTFTASVMMAGFAATLVAQTSATVPATPAGAVLIKAMTLTQTAPLHFGSIVLTTTAGGTCILASTGASRSFTGGCATSPATPIPTNAAYNVTGTINETYAVTLPATTTVTHTTLSSGVYQMDITLMTARFNGAGSDATTSTLTSSGTDSFTVGGTLTIKASQLGGIYAGTFPVSVDYN